LEHLGVSTMITSLYLIELRRHLCTFSLQ
jgi:hypothetical protein